MDDRSGLQVWYPKDLDSAGHLRLYGSPVVWDVTGRRGLVFRDLLAANRASHFEDVLCDALRHHPQPLARNDAPCPKLEDVAIVFSSTGCERPGSVGDYRIEAVTAWYRWRDYELALRLSYVAFLDDLQPEFRPRFGHVDGCPPPV